MIQPPVHLPPRPLDAHKGSFGRVLLIGASRGMSGSIALSAIAALRMGAGLVTAAVPDRCLETVASFHPSIMTLPLADADGGVFAADAVLDIQDRFRQVSAIGCGPGMGMGPGAVRIVERLIETVSVPRVLDADGLNCLASLWGGDSNSIRSLADSKATLGPLILTPHPGELQRLTGVPASAPRDQLDAARELSKAIGAVIVVKGGPTRVVQPGQVWTNPTGNPGMATAGSGDVLTGMILALLGQRLTPWDAARLGVWVHGFAGDLAAAQCGEIAMTSREILDALAAATKNIATERAEVD